MAAQAGLCLAWSETPEDTFCHDEAQIFSETKHKQNGMKKKKKKKKKK